MKKFSITLINLAEKSLTKANIVAQFAHLAALFDLLLKQAEVRQQIGDEKT